VIRAIFQRCGGVGGVARGDEPALPSIDGPRLGGGAILEQLVDLLHEPAAQLRVHPRLLVWVAAEPEDNLVGAAAVGSEHVDSEMAVER